MILSQLERQRPNQEGVRGAEHRLVSPSTRKFHIGPGQVPTYLGVSMAAGEEGRPAESARTREGRRAGNKRLVPRTRNADLPLIEAGASSPGRPISS